MLSLSFLAALMLPQGAPQVAPGSADPVTPAPATGPRYVLVQIGALGGESGNAICINESSQVVGSAENSSFLRHAYLWAPDTGPVDLDPGNPGVASEAAGINDIADIVGNRWDPSFSFRATLWSAGSTIDLGAPAGSESFATAINNQGQIVGSIGLNPVAVYWDADLNLHYLPGFGPSLAWAINDNGMIVGSAGTSAAAFTPEQAAIWRVDPVSGAVSGPEFIGSFSGDDYSEAKGVNDRGVVVGWHRIGQRDYAFFSHAAPAGQPRSRITIAWREGVVNSVANCVNNQNQVVGSMGLIGPQGTVFHAFLWTGESGLIDLNDQLANDFGQQWILVQASSINDRGEIAGYGLYQGELRGYVLFPVGSGDS